MKGSGRGHEHNPLFGGPNFHTLPAANLGGGRRRPLALELRGPLLLSRFLYFSGGLSCHLRGAASPT